MKQSVHVADVAAGFYDDRRTKVWLQCNGEPYDFRLLMHIGIRKIADEIELVDFTCPRCGKRHQSFRYT